ncbi:MAG: pre-peptidase C-terminal domain-containing protein [Planctomycetes bacterium]|nr:pre-peptidase C-terminal domain-containing protein [Planctomycetota bacterium]
MSKATGILGLGLILAMAAPILAADPDEAKDISSARGVSGLCGSAGSGKLFKVYIPSGTSSLTVSTTGGEGDCDLYVRHAYWPTLRDYDSRSSGRGTQERVSIRNPQSGWWGILVQADRAYDDVTLRVQFDSGDDRGKPIDIDRKVVRLDSDGVLRNLSGGRGELQYFRITVPRGTDRLTVSTSGGSGDCDLYVRQGDLPASGVYDGRSTGGSTSESISVARPSSGDWYILIHGFRDYSGVTLRASCGGSGWDDGNGGTLGRLENGVTVRNISGSAGSMRYGTIRLPEGTRRLVVTLDGGQGNCDLVLRRELPTVDLLKRGPFGIAERPRTRIELTDPDLGLWYVIVYGTDDYRGASLTAEWTGRGREVDLAITSPAAGDRWQIGRSYTISWTCHSSVRTVQLQYSTDNGSSWSLAGLPRSVRADRGSLTWDIPDDSDLLSSSARIRMVNVDDRTIIAGSGMFAVVRRGGGGGDNRRDAYEPDNDRDKAGTIGLRSPQLHSIFPDEDVDWIAFEPGQCGSYTFNFSDVSIPLKGELWVRKTNGKEERIEKFKVDRNGGAVQFDVGSSIDAVMVKVEAQDDDDKGIYTITVYKSQIWVR